MHAVVSLFSLPLLVIYAACLCCLILLCALLLASSRQPGFTRTAAALVCFLPVPAAPLHLSCKFFRHRARKWKNEQIIFLFQKRRGICWQVASSVRPTAGKVIRNTLKIIGRVDFGGETAVAFSVSVPLMCRMSATASVPELAGRLPRARDSAESDVIMHFLCCRHRWTQRASCQSCV